MATNFNADELVQKDRDHLWHHITNHKAFEKNEPKIMVEGDGLKIKDIRGNEYLDAVSGAVWCVNVGYGQERISKAVYEQLQKMPYYAGAAGNIPAIELADKLADLLPGLDKVFFSNSGSEANEKAFKMVRQYFRKKYNKDKYKILFRNRDYHGTTLAALSATGQEQRKEEYGPFLDGFVEFPHALCYRCEFGKTYPDCNLECAHKVEDIIKKEDPDTVGAIIVEPITAGGGIIPPAEGYYKVLQDICEKYNVLLIMDEVVCGFGRTGTMFGHEHYDVKPDMVTMAKGMASSYAPLSATVVKKEIFDEFIAEPGDKLGYFRDISTYGGCAGACAAGVENLKIIEDDNLLDNATKMGEYFHERLQELKDYSVVGDIRGLGLLAGIELVLDKENKTPMDEEKLGKIKGDITAEGVLVGNTNRSFDNNLNNVINLAPALIVKKEEIDKIVDSLHTAFKKAEK